MSNQFQTTNLWVKGVAKITVLATLGLSGIASGEECLSPGAYDSAYVPCISAVDWGGGGGWHNHGSGSSGSANHCYSYNRDGRTCSFVGFSEGQVGHPWGHGNGQFRCTNGCLQYIGQ